MMTDFETTTRKRRLKLGGARRDDDGWNGIDVASLMFGLMLGWNLALLWSATL